MTSRFFIEDGLRSGKIAFGGSEFHHMVRVTRHQIGDTVRLFDGTGLEADAKLTFISRHTATLDVDSIEEVPEETGPRFTLAVPLPKASRAGWLVEKAVELGVSRIIPIRTSRSVVDPRASRLDTLRQSVIAASKQSGRSRLMSIDPVVEWAELLKQDRSGRAIVVAHPGGAPFTTSLVTESLSNAVAGAKTKTSKLSPELLAVVGPEGGFTVEEISQAATNDARLVSLGPRLLRVETATLMMASVFLSAQLQG